MISGGSGILCKSCLYIHSLNVGAQSSATPGTNKAQKLDWGHSSVVEYAQHIGVSGFNMPHKRETKGGGGRTKK